MATHTRETVTTTVHRWIVPADGPYGAAAAEVGKAWREAERAYRKAYNLPQDDDLFDNALTFHPEDDAIVISFTTEAEGVPQRGTRLCHDTDPTTLKECALKAGHPGSHADANTHWEATR